jgi:hypothetical protein
MTDKVETKTSRAAKLVMTPTEIPVEAQGLEERLQRRVRRADVRMGLGVRLGGGLCLEGVVARIRRDCGADDGGRCGRSPVALAGSSTRGSVLEPPEQDADGEDVGAGLHEEDAGRGRANW